jgi:hypothetical protein
VSSWEKPVTLIIDSKASKLKLLHITSEFEERKYLMPLRLL